MSDYLWTPPPVRSLPVRGESRRLPINRLFFVGRTYHAHAVEMGRPVDKSVERPFYFTKAPQTLVEIYQKCRKLLEFIKLQWGPRSQAH